MLEQLPELIFVRILCYLEIESVFSLFHCSRCLQRLVSDNYDCRSLNFEGSHLHEKNAVEFVQAFGARRNISCLNLNYCWWISTDNVKSILQSCRNLKELHVLECRVPLSMIEAILLRTESITSLSIDHSCKSFEARSVARRQTLFNTEDNITLQIKLSNIEKLTVLVRFTPKHRAFRYPVFEFNYLKKLKSLNLLHVGTCARIFFSRFDGDLLNNISGSLESYICKEPFPYRDWHDERCQLDDEVTGLRKCISITERIQCKRLIVPQHLRLIWCCHKFPTIFKRGGLEQFQGLAGYLHYYNDVTDIEELFTNNPKLTFYDPCEDDAITPVKLKIIAANCQDLQVLNLMGCRNALVDVELGECGPGQKVPVGADLSGIKDIIDLCNIQELNLTSLCGTNCGKPWNEAVEWKSNGHTLCQLISRLKGLRCLALAACCIIGRRSEEHAQKATDELTHELSKKKRISRELAIPSGELHLIVEGCPLIEVFELYGTLYQKPRWKPLWTLPWDTNELQVTCSGENAGCKQVVDGHLVCIQNWSRLKKLSLGYLRGLKWCNFLSPIVEKCRNLEFLSLAHLGPSGICSYSRELKESLSKGHQLKHIRLEERYLPVDAVLLSLCEAKSLQRLCLFAIKQELQSNAIYHCVNQCTNLRSLYLSSANTIKSNNERQKCIQQRYNERPAFSIAMMTSLPNEAADDPDRQHRILKLPLQDIFEILYYRQSSVACNPNGSNGIGQWM